MLAYQKRVLTEIAALMNDAGLTPSLQFGEFCWWYFPLSEGGMAFYDSDTRDAARAALEHELFEFHGPDQDPSVAPADALFLRNRLRDHVAALAAEVRGKYPNARIEVLFPYDVNYPKVVGMHALGGRLLRYVNFPAEWERKQTSGLDTIKMEGLDFGAWTHNLDLATDVMRFPPGIGKWQLEQSGYLKSSPQLVGTIHSFNGSDSDHRAMLDTLDKGGDWTTGQRTSSPSGVSATVPSTW